MTMEKIFEIRIVELEKRIVVLEAKAELYSTITERQTEILYDAVLKEGSIDENRAVELLYPYEKDNV